MEGGVISRVARNIRRGSNFHARNARTIELLCLDRARYRTHGICSSSYAVSLRVDPSGIHRDIRKFIHAERSRYKESCISRWNPLIVASNDYSSQVGGGYRILPFFEYTRYYISTLAFPIIGHRKSSPRIISDSRSENCIFSSDIAAFLLSSLFIFFFLNLFLLHSEINNEDQDLNKWKLLTSVRRSSNNEHDSNRDFAHPFHCSYDYRV